RSCPVCKSNFAKPLMHFTIKDLISLNKTLKLDKLKNLIKGNEEFLMYSECESCKMVYNDHYWEDDLLNEYYGDIIDHDLSYQKVLEIKKKLQFSREWNSILRTLQFLGRKNVQGLKLLDFGCGWGDFMDAAFGCGIEVIGFDQDNKKIDSAKRRGHNIINSITELIKIGQVDIIVMNSVLEHLQNVDYYMNLMRQLLKPNGLIIILVMDYRNGYIKKNAKRLRNNKSCLTKYLNPIEHVNIYNYDTIKKTLELYGFEFITTGCVLTFTNHPFIRSNFVFVKVFNMIESILSKFIVHGELYITAYGILR
ncbi:MAG TPA: class I SAM-dependent methyltransferase, partial [Candidatus Lokiarchaeia archaeon]